MSKQSCIIAVSFMILVTISSSHAAFANESLKMLPDEQQDFVRRYIEAVNTDDLGKLTTLSHKEYLGCIDTDNQDYYDYVFQQSLKYDIPSDYTVSFASLSDQSVDTEIEGARRLGLPYPVRPTHLVQIDFNKSEYSSVTIVRYLRAEDGTYYEASGCPTREMVNKFRVMIGKKEENRKRAERLFNALEKPLLFELTQLMKDGRKIEAWKMYSEATGESIATAKDVLSHVYVDQ